MSIQTGAREQLFTHVRRAHAPERMTRITRYLCAAMHLDEELRTAAFDELLDRPHNAIVPSYGFDIGPVLAHCLRSRQARFVRDLVMSGLMFAAFWLSPTAAVVFFFGSLTLGARVPIKERAFVAVFSVLGAFAVLWGLGRLTGAPLINTRLGPGYGGGLWSDTRLAAGLLALLWIAAYVISVLHRLGVYRTLRDELGPGAATSVYKGDAAHERDRIAHLNGAQLGNITLYSGRNPFLGSGTPETTWERAWSVVLEVDRPASENTPPDDVDVVELHEHVRRALMAMSEEWPADELDRPDTTGRRLPANERITGLSVDYQIIARGECDQYPRPLDGFGPPMYQGHPLIDPVRGLPYSKASVAARDAILRHPQAPIRCYQRVTVGATGQQVRDADGAVIAPVEDQDVVVSAFIYVAIEGNMLYAQFVADALPPVRHEFRQADTLISVPDAGLRRLAFLSAFRWVFGLGFRAPFSVAGRLIAMASGGSTSTAHTGFTTYDYGARMSVRELAAAPRLETYTQELDARKYLRLIERRLNEAMLDYLQRRKIDVSHYRRQMAGIINNGVIAGDISGGQFAVNVSGGQVTQEAS
jgi:hypothetical protein